MKLNFLLSLVFLLLISQSAYAADYSDVDETNKFYKSISSFSEKGILEGYEDGTFKPDQPINRAEALKVILKAFEIEKDTEVEVNVSFPDTNNADWFYEFITTGLQSKIIQGYEDGTFKPANQVLLAESLKMGLVASGVDFDAIEFKAVHPSVSEDAWYAKYFTIGIEKNFVELEPNGGLNPLRAYNRGEFVDLIYRISTVDTNDAESEFDITYNWKTEANEDGLKISYPFEWEYFTLGEGVFLGYFAGEKQTFIRNVPNGARISINFRKNPELESPKTYFEKIRLQFETDYRPLKIDITETDEDLKVFISEAGIYEYYKFLDAENILIAEGSFDSKSLKAPELVEEIKEIFRKIQVDKKLALTASEKLELARKNILVTGKGKEILNTFIDSQIIETDTLGVGTGPVDYYYIPGVNHTIKYERSTDVILDIQTGETTNF